MITAIIQARTGSTRLPNKVFADIEGYPLIWHVVNRLKSSQKIEQIVLATTTNPSDAALQIWADAQGIRCFRGSEDNVLDRYFQAAKLHNASTIVRITADDPFKDPQVIDQVIEYFFANNLDFAYNNNPPSYPEGLDTEVFSFEALDKANKTAATAFEREHVTQHFYKNTEMFSQQNISYKENISHLRWTIDTSEDLEMTKVVYKEFFKGKEVFLLEDILKLLTEKPDIQKMNQDVSRSSMYTKN